MQNAHRGLSIGSAKLTEDGRPMSEMRAEPMPWRSWYALAIPGVKAPGVAGLGTIVDVDFPMAGIEATVNLHNVGFPGDTEVRWLPHFSPDVSFDLGRSSSRIDALRERLMDQHVQAT